MHPVILGHPEPERQLWGVQTEPVWQRRIHPRGLLRPRYGTGLGAGKIVASSWRGEVLGLWGGSVPGWQVGIACWRKQPWEAVGWP